MSPTVINSLSDEVPNPERGPLDSSFLHYDQNPYYPGTAPYNMQFPFSSGTASYNLQLPSTDSAPFLIESMDRYRDSKDPDYLGSEEWKGIEKSYLEHVRWRFSYPAKAFQQNLFSSWAITFLVISLVLTGIIFSGFQLYHAIVANNLTSLSTQVAIETAGKISISSSIVGATVLIVSLAFFYLYLRYVYGAKFTPPPHISYYGTDVAKMRSKEENDDTNE